MGNEILLLEGRVSSPETTLNINDSALPSSYATIPILCCLPGCCHCIPENAIISIVFDIAVLTVRLLRLRMCLSEYSLRVQSRIVRVAVLQLQSLLFLAFELQIY